MRNAIKDCTEHESLVKHQIEVKAGFSSPFQRRGKRSAGPSNTRPAGLSVSSVRMLPLQGELTQVAETNNHSKLLLNYEL